MASTLNAGYFNNINIIEMRETATSLQRYTDRALDVTGDGIKEKVSVVTTPTGVGSKVREIVTKPAGVARSVIKTTIETDGGVHSDGVGDNGEYTVGGA